MANEIQFTDATGRADYATLTNSVGLWYNPADGQFEAFDANQWADYALPATEFGATGTYAADMPPAPAGAINVVARRQAGVSPSPSDPVVAAGEIQWNGAAVLSLNAVTVTVLATGVLTATAWADSGANRLADHVRRRSQANVELSAYGDTLTLTSEYGFVQQAQESDTTTTAGKLSVFKTDGVTLLGVRDVAVDAASEPVVGVH